MKKVKISQTSHMVVFELIKKWHANLLTRRGNVCLIFLNHVNRTRFMADLLVNCFQMEKVLPMSCLALSLLTGSILLFSKVNALTLSIHSLPITLFNHSMLTRITNVAISISIKTFELSLDWFAKIY